MAASAFFATMQLDESSAEDLEIFKISGDMEGEYKDLADAFEAINNHTGTDYSITVVESDPEVSAFVLSAGKNVTIRSSENKTFVLTITTTERHGIVSGCLTIENIVFDGNNNGGGVEVKAGAALTMNSGAAIQNCYFKNEGGAVSSEGTFTMNGGSIIGNTATRNGGGVYNAGTFIMNGGEISGNIGKSRGGGVYSTGPFNMNGGVIGGSGAGKNAAAEGAGVFFVGPVFEMKGGEISYNETTYYGGGAVSTYTTFNMYGGKISYNSGNGGGGVLNYGYFNMYGGEISHNTAVHGGGVHNNGSAAGASHFSMSGGLISDNRASYTGGGVYCAYNSTIKMSGSAVISGNSAFDQSYVNTFGGGVSCWYESAFTLSGETVISGNSAGYGGGVVIYYGSAFAMYDTAVIIGNTAAFYGGGIYNWKDSVSEIFGKAHICGNKAGTWGGGAHNDTATLRISGDGMFHDNTSKHGGGLFSINGTIEMSGNAAVKDNIATGYGGGVYNHYYTSYTIFTMSDNAAVVGNSASFAGGVYNVSKSVIEMSGGKISGNTAGNYGGGVLTNGTFNMKNGEVSGNKAKYGGGFFNNGILTITGGKITGNDAKGPDDMSSGGGIYTVNYAKLTVGDGVEFSGNKAPTLRMKDIEPGADLDGNGVDDRIDYSNNIGKVVLSAPVNQKINAPAYNNYDINYLGDVYVVFVDIVPDGGGEVTYTYDSGSGIVSDTMVMDGYFYVPSYVGSITFSAVPGNGYIFSKFITGTTETDEVLIDVTISGDTTVIAVFEAIMIPVVQKGYFITATSDYGSSINPSGTVMVQSGGDRTFVFSAKPGHQISAVCVDGVELSLEELAAGKYTFRNVLSNHTITVVSKAHTGGATEGDDPETGSGGGDIKGEGSKWAVLNLICAIIAVIAGAAAVIAGKNRRRKMDAEDGAEMNTKADEDERERSGPAFILRILALVVGIVSVIVFFLTEDWRLPVAAVDEWTLLMIVLLIAVLILALVSIRFDERTEEDEEEEAEIIPPGSG